MNNALLKLYVTLQSLTAREEGQDLVEYALIIALIGLVLVVTLGTTGSAINNVFNKVNASLNAVV